MDLPNKSDSQDPGPPPKKQIQPVISGATQVSRPATRRIMDFMFAESPKDLSKKVVRDVFVPQIKVGLEQAFNGFVAGMFWGGGSTRPMGNMVKGTVLRGGGINYNNPPQPMGTMSQAAAVNQTRSPGSYQDVVCRTQIEAERLLANLFDLFNQYNVVCVADLYELARITPTTIDNAYGWTNLDSAKITQDRNGFRVELPRPTII